MNILLKHTIVKLPEIDYTKSNIVIYKNSVIILTIANLNTAQHKTVAGIVIKSELDQYMTGFSYSNFHKCDLSLWHGKVELSNDKI